MTPRRKLRLILRDWTAIILAVVAFGLGIWFWLGYPGVSTQRVTLTAGRAGGQRHQIAELLAEEGRRLGVDASVRETAGSEESLDLVNAGKLDFALVQGGLGAGGRNNIRQ